MKKIIILMFIGILVYIGVDFEGIEFEVDKKINILENTLNKCCGNNGFDMVCYQKSVKGKLSNKDKENITNEIIQIIDGDNVDKISCKKDDMWIIYGYTNKIKEYLDVNDEKINYNIAITYNEENNLTNIYLGSPIINVDI